ncbi:LacI family DNA-binding transcriptional regulator [Nakamurella lactea]|uniref:LacI family DNA-binding transcriptional regulator n=1 Tax=Nakamurella lactea TaxID=459515 RepID=UPI00040EA04B|nr:LacI family DNA-binding transcriptional regulator [Nakamurella lactea]
MVAASISGQRVTLAAVARTAGVSVSTASLAFSGLGPVSDATRDKVLAAADTLGYSGPDPRARSLRQGRSGVVGMLVENSVIRAFRDPVNVGMVDGVAEVLGDAGAGVLLLTDAPHARSAFDNAAMDGMVLSGCSPLVAELLESLRRRHIPTVLLGSRARPGVPAVDVDNLTATEQLARRLAELGHRQAATVTLPLDAAGTQFVSPALLAGAGGDTAADRLRGFWSVFPTGVALAATDSTVEEGERIGRLLLDRVDRPTAVVAQSDLLAAGVVRAAEGLGLAVPTDLSVVGFDGIELQTFTSHALTTMRQPMQDKGRTAARTVLRLIEGGRPRSVTLDCEFVPGTTIAPPPP